LVAVLAVLAAGVLFAVNYFQTSLNQRDSDATVTPPIAPATITAGKLIIGTDPTFKPMEFPGEDQKIVGYDIDLATRLAQELGLEVEVRNIHWDNVFTSLENKEIDAIMSSVSITDERKQKYGFSDPYINAGQVIITRKETTDINSTADLAGKKIAVQNGTTNEEQAIKYTDETLVMRFVDFPIATQALLDGEADAIFADLTVAKGITTDNPTLKIASEPFTSDYYGIVMHKDNALLHSQVNAALEKLRQQGFLVFLKQKWLE